jgi:glutathione peroxidase-family protein
MTTFTEFTMNSIAGDPVDFSQFDGQMCLIVNVASN